MRQSASVEGLRLTILSTLLAGSACEISVDECEGLRREHECVDADVEFGSCVWVEEIRSTSTCSDGERRGMCVGLSGAQQGCAAHSCEGSQDGVNAWFREHDDGSVSVFVNPQCGPQPAGDWTACPDGGPSQCDCACAIR